MPNKKLYKCVNKAGEYLAYLRKKKPDSQIISSITDRHSKQSFDTVTINDIKENLYKCTRININAPELMDAFLSSFNLSTLSDNQKSLLDSFIARKEVLDAIKGLQSGKAPEPDGLSSEFYKELQNISVEPLLNMFNDSFKTGVLPMSLTEANISLNSWRTVPHTGSSLY